MALVFPVVHDFTGAGTPQWETLTSTSITGSDTEINPVPDENGTLFDTSNDQPFTPIRHNGKLVLQYPQRDGSDAFTRIVRQLNNGTWETLGAAEDLGFSLTHNSDPQGIFSHDGNLYAGVRTYPKDPANNLHSTQTRFRIYRYNESLNTWEQETNTTTGLSHPPGTRVNGGGIAGKFFSMNGTLYYRWGERSYSSVWPSITFGSQDSLIIAEENNGSWSRIASLQPTDALGEQNQLFSEDVDTFTIAGGHAYLRRAGRIFRFTPGSGLTEWGRISAAAAPRGTRYADWGGGDLILSGTSNVTQINGQPVVTFVGGQDSFADQDPVLADKYCISTINSTAESFTRTNYNNPASNLIFRSMIEENGEEYYLFQSYATGNKGLVLYRKNGNTWSIVGGTLAVPALENYFTKLRIFGGSVYIFSRAYGATTSNYVIRRFPL